MFDLVKKYFSYHIKELIGYALIFILSSILGLLAPIIQSQFFDELIYGNNLNKVSQLIVLIAVIMLLTLIISYITNLLLVKLKENISMDIKSDLVKHLQKCLLLQVEQFDSTYLTQQINNDCGNLMGVFLGNYVSLLCSTISIFFILYFISSISTLFLILFFLFIPLYALTYVLFKKKIYDCKYEKTEEQNKFFGVFNQQLRNIRQIKQNADFRASEKKLNISYKIFYKKVVGETKLSQFYNGTEQIISALFQVAIFLLSSHMIFNKVITFGQITIILSYFQLLKNYIVYFMSLGEYYQSAKVSSSRIQKIFNLELETNGEINLRSINEINLNNITFSYQSQDQADYKATNLVFKSFDCKFQKGNVYSICGDNGMGKSTLMNIILGLYQELQSGSVTYDGIIVSKLDLYNMRENSISVVSQTICFSDDTVSMLFKLPETDFFQYIDNFGEVSLFKNESFNIISFFNKKLNSLSGGEKQKIALCYALYKKPQLLLLDEPTSSLDAKSIPLFIDLLYQLKKNMLIIVITHDKSIQNSADHNIYLSKNERDVLQ